MTFRVEVLVACACAVAVAISSAAAERSVGNAEDADALTQYRQMQFNSDPRKAEAGLYKLDPHHASVTVRLAHMDLARYTLRFDAIDASFEFSPGQSTASQLVVSIQSGSVDTGDPAFDKKIATRYLDAPRYPLIRFTAVASTLLAGRASVAGLLTLHGIERPVTLDVVYRGAARNRMGVSATATIKRSDFGVGEWVPLEGDEVSIVIEAEFLRQ